MAQLTKHDMMRELAELGEYFWAGEAEGSTITACCMYAQWSTTRFVWQQPATQRTLAPPSRSFTNFRCSSPRTEAMSLSK